MEVRLLLETNAPAAAALPASGARSSLWAMAVGGGCGVCLLFEPREREREKREKQSVSESARCADVPRPFLGHFRLFFS